MRITNLAVANYSRLRDVEIPVRDHLVIVGPNNVGKTSLLRAIDWAMGASMAKLYANVSSEDFRDLDEPLEVIVTCGALSKLDMATFADVLVAPPGDGPPYVQIALRAHVDDGGAVSIERGALKNGVRRALSRDQFQHMGWTMLEANHSNRDLRRDRSGALDAVLRSLDTSNESSAFEEAVTSLNAAIAASESVSSLRETMGRKLAQILDVDPDDGNIDIRSPLDVGAALSGADVYIGQAGVERTLYDQSDGVRALVATALHDLRHAGESMLAIDEPEIHLHPSSQRALGALLVAGDAQKILATHSPDIVGQFSPESIVAVNGGGQVTQCKNALWAPNEKQFAQWWIRERLEPLTASHVIAVEGVADRVIVEACARATGRNLDRRGVCVFDADGSNNVGHIWRLFGPSGFDRRLQIIIDDDAAKSDVTRALRITEADFPAHRIYVSRADLEDEYVRALGSARLAAALPGWFPPGMLQSKGVRVEDNPDHATMRSFCAKNKVAAAMCAATLIDEDAARLIASIEAALCGTDGP